MTESGHAIRRAVLADAPRLAAFAERVFIETFGSVTPPDQLALHVAGTYGVMHQERELEDPRVTTIVAERDSTLSAYAQVRASSPPPCVPSDRPTIELWRFYVDTPWHGTGLARALMLQVRAIASDGGAATIWLSMWEHNHRARRFYERCGFREVGTHPFVVGTMVDIDRIFVLDLAGDAAL
jgi:ribosomal protein S18 acetylase RimI-like enzyme